MDTYYGIVFKDGRWHTVAMKDEGQVRRFMERVLRLKYFSRDDGKVTSPKVIRDVWSKTIEISGETDPLKEVKNEQSNKALAIYPIAREVVLKSSVFHINPYLLLQ